MGIVPRGNSKSVYCPFANAKNVLNFTKLSIHEIAVVVHQTEGQDPHSTGKEWVFDIHKKAPFF